MKELHGDLIQLAQDGEFDVIVHGCNCFCTMGAGIAKSIKQHFPAAYKVDCATRKGDPKKLGTVSIAYGEIRLPDEPTVVNGYTQYKYGKGVQVSYPAVRKVFKKVKELFQGLRIGYPKIGAGLAGGDWDVISAIIDEELKGEDHTLVIYRLS